MSMAVLRPEDCLKGNTLHEEAFGRIRPRHHRRKDTANPPVQSNRPKPNRSPPPKIKSNRTPSPKPKPNQSCRKAPPSPVMEGVRLLKRGEELRPVPPEPEACSTGRVGPDPEKPAEKVGSDRIETRSGPVYAGSAFQAASPEPSSLPFPAFLRRSTSSGASSSTGEEASRSRRSILGFHHVS